MYIRLLCLMLAVITFGSGGPWTHFALAQDQNDRCFEETGQCIQGRFGDFWQQNGGLAVFGFPVTPAKDEVNPDTGKTYMTQWFERNRFELHPENGAPYDVLLGRLGDQRLRQHGRDWQVEPGEEGAQAGCLWFPQTRHNICDQVDGVGFKSYWQTNGLQDARLDRRGRSLALFGLPLTAPAMETNSSGETVLTQWFERARFEWHPDKPDPYKVLLGLVGSEVPPNLVGNGDFETPGIVGRGYVPYEAGQSFGGWMVESGSVDHVGGDWQAASGRQSIELNGHQPGGIARDLALIPWETYRLRFAMAGNPLAAQQYACIPGIKQMTVMWSDRVAATLAFDTTGHSTSDMGWMYHEYVLVAEAHITRLTFRSGTPATWYGPVLDDVSVTQAAP